MVFYVHWSVDRLWPAVGKYLSLYSKTVDDFEILKAINCFILLFQSALLIYSCKEVTEKVLFSRLNQGGSRRKHLFNVVS